MPKSSLVKPENIYADVETRAWVAKQDWKAKFAKLPAARRALFEELARAHAPGKKPAASDTPKVPTARALFIERHKKECMDQGLSATDAKKKLGLDWAALSEEERLRYEKRVLNLKAAALKADNTS